MEGKTYLDDSRNPLLVIHEKDFYEKKIRYPSWHSLVAPGGGKVLFRGFDFATKKIF